MVIIPVKVDSCVGRVIIFSMKGQELLKGEVRYVFRVSTGIKTVGIVRKK